MNVQPKVASAFLRERDPNGYHFLVAFSPETGKPVSGALFQPGDWAAIERWVQAQGHLNLYFTVNEVRADIPPGTVKPRKEHIGWIRAVVADLDPPGCRDASATPEQKLVVVREQRAELYRVVEELAESEHPPSVSWDTGNGVQSLWDLVEKLDAKVYGIDAEELGRGIARELEGDSVFNRDRIMRLPGSINRATPDKRERGLVGGPVQILVQKADAPRYTLDELETEYEPEASPDATDQDAGVQAALLELNWNAAQAPVPEALRARLMEAKEHDAYFAALLQGDASATPKDPTGSGWRGALVRAFKSRDFTLNDYAAVVLRWEPGQPREGALSPRVIARDWARVGGQVEAEQKKKLDLFGDLSGQEIDTSDFPAPVPETYELGEPTPKVPRGLKRVPFAEAAELARTAGRRPLIKGLLDQGAMTVLYGDSNVGKTFVTLLIAHHIATGETFAGMRVTKSPVVYVAAEGGHGVTLRIEALLRTKGDAPGFDLVLSSVDLFDPNADLEELIALLKTGPGVGLLVLDTLARVMAGGDENAVQDMMGLVRNIDRIRAETAAHVLVVHHTGKDASKGARGSSALRGATDTEIEVAPGQIAVTKQRDLPKTWQHPFAIKGVDLWKDEDGDQVSAAVAELVATRAEVPPGMATAKEQEVLNALRVASETTEDARGGVKVDEIVSVMDGTDKGTVRVLLHKLLEKRLVAKVDRGVWRPVGRSAPGAVNPHAVFEVIPDEDEPDKTSEPDLFD